MFLLTSLVVIFLIALCWYDYSYSGKKTHQENAETELQTIRCGGSFGLSNYTSPLVRHTIYEKFLVIGYRNKKIVLNFKDIDFVNMPLYFMSQQIRYHHNRPDLPKKIVIRAKNLEETLELITQKGIRVEQKNA